MDKPLIIIFCIGCVGLLSITPLKMWYEKKHPCIKSHIEEQRNMPASIVVGQTKGFGGVGVPIGNAKLVKVTVCDERK